MTLFQINSLLTEAKRRSKVICIDFDGVINSYTSGWTGHTRIPDPPVPGAIDFLNELYNHNFSVVIFSTRCGNKGAIKAIKKYLRENGCDNADDFRYTNEKVPAHMYIDDRAFAFKGKFPSVGEIEAFEPWYE